MEMMLTFKSLLQAVSMFLAVYAINFPQDEDVGHTLSILGQSYEGIFKAQVQSAGAIMQADEIDWDGPGCSGPGLGGTWPPGPVATTQAGPIATSMLNHDMIILLYDVYNGNHDAFD
ncbi:hypothetical protein SAY86_019937 [Trapa natans]|uniref:Dirigent protein n=1 Tax=Trapa natans TaxID=22666 RepID=A0AAN7LYK3_TRANT|nr:hypothetical protein SAY86_019937 [Trapa natans]